MASTMNIYSADAVGVVPSALIVLMTVLALLGIIAGVAAA